MIGLFFTAAFTFSATGETAVTYADRLEVGPLEAGARDFQWKSASVRARTRTAR